MKNITITIACCFVLWYPSFSQKQKAAGVINDRAPWITYIDKVARPVMVNLAADQLKEKMPGTMSKRIDNAASRSKVAYLEAFGRTLCGIAPWLNLEGGSATEVALRNRGAAFQHLADMALRKQLPASLKPAQVRAALTVVIKKTLDAPGSFNKDGWLNIGVAGDQPDLTDVYNTTGSLYLCSVIFLPLGLPETDEFWSAPALPWSSVKIWSGNGYPRGPCAGPE